MSKKSISVDPGVVIMNVREVAGYLRLSEAKVYKMANEGQMPALRVGKSWRFKRDLIDEWIRRETKMAARVHR
ncbi:MAG: helix-turn-helix domain-containing protein [Anaerolineales bacterium]|jgi:excisionase family DNA binding protein